MIRQIIRSMLFVPGSRPDWVDKALAHQPDAILFDLEDSVPASGKEQARRNVRESCAALADNRVAVFVRVNAWGTGALIADVDALVGKGLDGIVLPKVERLHDIQALELVLDDLERQRGLRIGGIEIVPTLETALGVERAYPLLAASGRVHRVPGVGDWSPGGDFDASLGYVRTYEGVDTQFFSSKILLAARAAGLPNPLGGLVAVDVNDLDYVRSVMTRAKAIGATGAMVIHPSHVAIANEVHTPSTEDVTEALELLHVLDEAFREGSAAVRHRGGMIDIAHGRGAARIVDAAQSAGEVDDGYWATLGPDLRVALGQLDGGDR
jgi:citrate lyase subunit beta/citryl-CoA lyase